MFIKSEDSDLSFEGHTLVIPSLSTGSAPVLGTDLYLLNNDFKRAGYFYSKNIAHYAGADIFKSGSSEVTLSCEIWTNAQKKQTFLVIRSGLIGGKTRKFIEELLAWKTEAKLGQIIILSSTYNPLRKLRASNLMSPTLYFYSSEGQKEQWKGLGLTPWAHWLEEHQKIAEHIELEELEDAGFGQDLFEKLLKQGEEVSFIVMFSQGGSDVVGAHSYFKFLHSLVTGEADEVIKQLEGVTLDDLNAQRTQCAKGAELLQKMFSPESEFTIPEYWKSLEI